MISAMKPILFFCGLGVIALSLLAAPAVKRYYLYAEITGEAYVSTNKTAPDPDVFVWGFPSPDGPWRRHYRDSNGFPVDWYVLCAYGGFHTWYPWTNMAHIHSNDTVYICHWGGQPSMAYRPGVMFSTDYGTVAGGQTDARGHWVTLDYSWTNNGPMMAIQVIPVIGPDRTLWK
jgi:hypothetical protein